MRDDLTSNVGSSRDRRRGGRPKETHGEIPKWPTGTDCKSVGSAFAGSNPALPTTTRDGAIRTNGSERADGGVRNAATNDGDHGETTAAGRCDAAGVTQWQSASLPSSLRGFDS